VQNSLRDADKKYKVGTRITMRNFSVTAERGKPPLVVVDPSALSDGGLFVTDHGKIPAPPPSVHLNVLRLSEDNTLRLTRDHMSAEHCAGSAALAALWPRAGICCGSCMCH
jgi:hypothetical protein